MIKNQKSPLIQKHFQSNNLKPNPPHDQFFIKFSAFSISLWSHYRRKSARCRFVSGATLLLLRVANDHKTRQNEQPARPGSVIAYFWSGSFLEETNQPNKKVWWGTSNSTDPHMQIDSGRIVSCHATKHFNSPFHFDRPFSNP